MRAVPALFYLSVCSYAIFKIAFLLRTVNYRPNRWFIINDALSRYDRIACSVMLSMQLIKKILQNEQHVPGGIYKQNIIYVQCTVHTHTQKNTHKYQIVWQRMFRHLWSVIEFWIEFLCNFKFNIKMVKFGFWRDTMKLEMHVTELKYVYSSSSYWKPSTNKNANKFIYIFFLYKNIKWKWSGVHLRQQNLLNNTLVLLS